MKECNWCKKEVDEKAKICPYCGKRIWEEKHKKGIKKVGIIFGIIFGLLFIIIIVAALTGKKVEDYCKDAEFANLEEIYNLHATDQPKAESLYKDKYFKFKGKITHKYNKYIQIESNYISADTYFNSSYKDKAYEYDVDSEITYCGKVNFGLAIQVKNAMVIEESK